MLVFLTAVSIPAYVNILDAPFVFDDLPNIVNSPHIRLTELTLDGIINGTKGQSPFRPVAYLSFSLNYYFSRYNVTGFHLTNITIHIAVAFMVFLIAGHTLRLAGITRGVIPELSAIAWLVHPLHIQSVTYTVQRVNSLATLFFLLSLYLYILARLAQRTGKNNRLRAGMLFSGCLVSGLLALFSKEIAATLPVCILLYEIFFFQGLSLSRLKRPAEWLILIFVILIPIAILYIKASPVDRVLDSYTNKDFTLGQRLLTEPRVIVYYLSLLFFPHPARLNVDYDFPISNSPLDPIMSLLAITAIIALLIKAFYRPKHQQLLSFAILWFLGNLIIESSFIGLAIIFEHRTYLPSTFLIFALVTILIKKLSPSIAAVIISLAIITGMIWTHQRNAVWEDTLSLWRNCAEKTPGKAGPANGVGLGYQLHQQPEKALKWFLKAVQLNPGYHEAYSNVGGILINLGRAAEAVPYLEKAIALNPANHAAFSNLGSAMQRMNQLEKAAGYYRKSISIYPDYETAHNNLGAVLVDMGDVDLARHHLNQAIRINPGYPDPFNNLGRAMMRLGRTADAISYYQKAIALNPEYAMAHFNLGTACFEEQDLDCARRHLEQAARFAPNPVLALNNLTAVLVMQKEYGKAAETLVELIGLLPESATVRYNLACVYAMDDKKGDAIKYLKQAVNLGYDHWENMRKDPDLKKIRDTDYYQNLVHENTRKTEQ